MRARILESDPRLARKLGPASRERARLELVAEIQVLEPGDWEPPHQQPEPGFLGILLVEGIVTRRLAVAGATSVELLARGSLLRPWQEDSASFVRARWTVMQRARVAFLDADFAARMTHYPQVVETLFERAVDRARWLAVASAIDNAVGVESRIRLLLWHLAERWGSVDADGVVMPLRLTHQAIADLVGSRRPSVTTALKRLMEADAIAEHPSGGWRLYGSPPEPD